MNKPTLLVRARRQAHSFIEILWGEIGLDTAEDVEDVEFDSQLYLAAFDIIVHEEELSGFELLAAVRRRAEAYYRSTYKRPHHDRATWAFFRFRLELALLETIGADSLTIHHCYIWHDLTAELAIRLKHLN